MNRRFAICLLNWGAGLMDGLTGALLVVAPDFTLRLMGISGPESGLLFVSYLGVFVFSVGFSHFLAGRFPTDAIAGERWRTIWIITSFVRLSVAGFVSVQLFRCQLEPAWAVVAATDFSVAVTFLSLLHLKVLQNK